MIPTQILGNVVRMDTPAVYAYYIVESSSLFPLALVCDDNDILVGVIGSREIDPWSLYRTDIRNKCCGEICARNFTFLETTDEEPMYINARNIFAEKPIMTLPIINDDGVPVGLFGRFQAFFRDMYRHLPYHNYSYGLIDAAEMAKSRNYDRISAIEFGVAGGRGLVHMELYAKEVQKLYNVGIDVYGFDSGVGLPPPVDYRDIPQQAIEGDFIMDIEALQKKLCRAKLIIGDICQTTKTFLSEYNPSPIGFMVIDVDLYKPAAAILDMLLGDDKYFLPIVTIDFEDIFDHNEFQGEALALREFNAKNEFMKIAPEYSIYNHFLWNPGKDSIETVDQNALLRLKWCNRFNHPLFATLRKGNRNLIL